MTIAINLIFSHKEAGNYNSNFFEEIFTTIAATHQQHSLIILVDKKINQAFSLAPNITQVATKILAKNNIATSYFYKIKQPIILKKYKPNVLIQATGYCSLTSTTSQILVLKSKVQCKAKHLAKAKYIIVNTQDLKNYLIEQYQMEANKIDVIYPAAKPIYQPLNFEQIMQTKDGFADGREYFLVIAASLNMQHFVDILKAFSLFKKWQKSNMKLLFAGNFNNEKNNLSEKLNNYKFKDDVVFVKDVAEPVLAKIIASAYCVLYPCYYDDFAMPVIQSIQSGVPVITGNLNCIKEFTDNTIIALDFNFYESIAEQMQKIYKDETLRSKLIKDGLQLASNFNWQNTVKQVWDIVEKVSNY